MPEKGFSEGRAATRGTKNSLLIPLNLSTDGGCLVSEEEKRKVSKQFRDVWGPTHIQRYELKLLIGFLRKVVSDYSSGGEEILYITSAEPLTTYLVDGNSQLN